MNPGTVTLRLIDLRQVSGNAMACLSGGEKLRAARFHFREDAFRWMTCRAEVRKILGEILGMAPVEVPLDYLDFGKPRLSSPHRWLEFNLSHGADLALIALSVDGPVGVDLEPENRAPSLLGCEKTFCHPEEIAELHADDGPRGNQLLRIWTAKEAFLKALGTGLSHPPESVRVLFEETRGAAVSDPMIPGLDGQRLHFPTHPALTGYHAVVSAPLAVTSVELA